jgi:predicted metal-dependent phosphoesterase TrpH
VNDGAPAPPGGARLVDLHLHTTASDGVLSPEQLVDACAAADLAAIAVTDHDSTLAVARAASAAAPLGMEVIPGVELSAREGDRDIHILGLHLEDLSTLELTLSRFRDSRVTRAAAIVAKLNSLGLAITMDDVERESAGSAIGRPHIARALVARGLVASVRIAFDRYLAAGRPAYVAKDLFTVAGALELIHRAGGIAVFAHPGADGSVETLSRFRALGLDGVEVRHPSHSAEDIARISTIAAHLGLLRSGGSDWHGFDAGRRKLGGEQIPWEWMELQREAALRIRQQRAGDGTGASESNDA